MQACTTEELITAFRPSDRRLIPVPDLSAVAWDEIAYLGWKEPSGHRGFLAARDADGLLRGMVMTFNKDSGASSGICDLCLMSRSASGTKAVMFETWFNPYRFVGLHICQHLDCSDAVLGKTRHEFTGETIARERKLARLSERVESFVTRNTAAALGNASRRF